MSEPHTSHYELRLASLPDVLDYVGEFGAELVLFVPFCHWLSKAGLLKERTISTYRGMRCFYEGLSCKNILEKDADRVFVKPEDRPVWLPVKDEHSFDSVGRSPFHLYPDLRACFRDLPLVPDITSPALPLLIIHNKYNNEWNRGPINQLDIPALDSIFRLLKHDFTIVYIRHGMHGKHPDFSADHNSPLDLHDAELLARHPEIHSFDKLHEAHKSQGGKQDLNTFKNVLYSRCFRFISSQGGGAHHIALFSGSLLAILHRRGSEEKMAYRSGYYRLMANIPPVLAVCCDNDELIRASTLFFSSRVFEGRMLLRAGAEQVLKALSPETVSQRLDARHSTAQGDG